MPGERTRTALFLRRATLYSLRPGSGGQESALLHDGAEAYLSDITRPVKKHLHNYAGYEQTLLDMIYRKYLGSTLAPDEERIVKQIDDDMLYFDLRDLLKEPVPEPEPVMCSTFTYEVIPFAETEQTYLELFHRWYPA